MSKVDVERLDGMNEGMTVLDLYKSGRLPNYDGKPIAVVFDIDDTLIDSSTHEIIVPMMLLYAQIQRMGIPIYLVTARPPVYWKETEDELVRNGINGYERLYMVDHYIKPVYHGDRLIEEDKAIRKARVRKHIEEKGYDILLNVGDDPGDMMYGYYLYGIKLPFLY